MAENDPIPLISISVTDTSSEIHASSPHLEQHQLTGQCSTPLLLLENSGRAPSYTTCDSTTHSHTSSLSPGPQEHTTTEDSSDTPLLDSTTTEGNPAFERTSSPQPHLEDVTFGSVKLLSPWFPSVDPENTQAITWRRKTAQRKWVLRICLITASVVCVINTILAGVAQSRSEDKLDGLVTLYQGDCNTVRRWDGILHALINILSTLLLSASNLTLQLMAAPTRKEVDKAHSKGVWLDIGVPSFRNLLHLSIMSRTMWFLLAISSIPIHFLYNSTVFSSISTNDFAWVIVNEDFLTGPPWNPYRMDGDISAVVNTIHDDYQANMSSYQHLNVLECLQNYSTPLAWRPNLIMVSSSRNSTVLRNSSVLAWNLYQDGPQDGVKSMEGSQGEPNPLCTYTLSVCNSLFSITLEDLEGPWVYNSYNINYCLSRQTDIGATAAKACHLQCAPVLLQIVAIFNLFKCVCILWVIKNNREPTLCILGDAIVSFLDTPDQYTKHLGITSKERIIQSGKRWSFGTGDTVHCDPQPIALHHAASSRRWLFTMVLSGLLIMAGMSIMIMGFHTQRKWNRRIALKNVWALGFGTPNIDEIFLPYQATEGTGLFITAVIANIFQALLSILYMLHNALLSCMMVAKEWVGFATERNTLRVSYPKGIQRSSYFISMPFTYGLPIMIFFFAEHWLLSQCLFIVRITRTDWTGLPAPGWIATGYSLFPCLLAFLGGVIIVVAQVLNAWVRKFPDPSFMPLASTCSAAISAACHRPEGDKEASLLPVQWSVVGKDELGRELCSFTTSRTTEAPIPGRDYLGMPDMTKKREGSWVLHLLKRRKGK